MSVRRRVKFNSFKLENWGGRIKRSCRGGKDRFSKGDRNKKGPSFREGLAEVPLREIILIPRQIWPFTSSAGTVILLVLTGSFSPFGILKLNVCGRSVESPDANVANFLSRDFNDFSLPRMNLTRCGTVAKKKRRFPDRASVNCPPASGSRFHRPASRRSTIFRISQRLTQREMLSPRSYY